MFKITETNDYSGLTEMFYRNGLEITPGQKAPEGLIKCWEAIDEESGKRAGGLALEKRDGEFVVGDVAIESEYRMHHLGTMLMEQAISEVISLGGRRVMLVAKAPAFHKTIGFRPIERKDSPNISKCLTCSQFQIDCFPEIMVLDLDNKGKTIECRKRV